MRFCRFKAFRQPEHQNTARSPKNTNTDNTAAEGRVTTQAKPMGFISAQLALRFTKPMPNTEPTRICVLYTGKPISEASITTLAAESSAVKPEAGCISARLVPTV